MAQCRFVSPSNRRCSQRADGLESGGLCIAHSRQKGKDRGKFLQRLKQQLRQGNFDFTGYVFPAPMSFRTLSFERSVSFVGTVFLGGADFTGCRFSGPTTSFAGAYFSGKGAIFEQATFTGKRLSFRRARVTGQTFSLKRARVACAETIFNEAQFEAKLTSFIQAHISGDRVTFEDFRCESECFTLEKCIAECGRWEMNRAACQCQTIVADGLHVTCDRFSLRESTFSAESINWNECTLQGEWIELDHSQFSAAQISWARGRWAGTERISWAGARFSGTSIDFEATQFHAGTTDFRELAIEADSFRLGGSRFEGDEVMLSKWRLVAGEVDCADMSIECNEADLTGWNWRGEVLSLDGLEVDANELNFAHADLSGGKCSMQRMRFKGNTCSIQSSKFSVEDVRLEGSCFGSERTLFRMNTFMGSVHFDDVSFQGEESVLWHNDFRGRTTSLRNARFPTRGSWIAEDVSQLVLSGASVARVDFTGSSWLRHGGRKRCLDEMLARGTDGLIEAADLYRQLKESHLRSGARGAAGDFLVGEIECYRHLASGGNLQRLSLILWLLNLTCGYLERPWRTAACWCTLVGIVAAMNGIVGSPHWLWPLGGQATLGSLFALQPSNLISIFGTLLITAGLGIIAYVWRRSRGKPLNAGLFRQAVPFRRSQPVKHKPSPQES